MRNVKTIVSAVMALALISFNSDSVAAKGAADWKIGEYEIGSLVWGKQEREIAISNLSDDYKFLTVNCRAISTRHGYSRPRSFKSHYIVFPKQDTILTFTIDVPENIAPVQVEISVHDVIDTLDDLSWGTELLKSEARYEVVVPSGIEAYKDSIPRTTGATRFSRSLGNDLKLLTNYLFAQGKTAEEIAELAGLTARDIRKYASEMRGDSLIRVVDGKILSTMTVLQGLPYYPINTEMNKHIDLFTRKLSDLMPVYTSKLSELVESGVITGDRDDAFEGTAFLHHYFPIVGGVVLWERLSTGFVSADTVAPQLIDIFNPCTRNSAEYDYLLADNHAPDGWHLFFNDVGRNRKIFGSHVPAFDCSRANTTENGKNFRFPRHNQPVFFSFSYSKTAEAIAEFVDPLMPLRDQFVSDMQRVFAEAGIEMRAPHRLWLWNQLASNVLKRLVKEGTIENLDQKFFVWNDAL